MFKKMYLAGLCVVLLVAAGCGNNQTEKEGEARSDVTLQLYWTPYIEFAGIYAGIEEGFYEEENLNLTVLDGGYDAEGNYTNVPPLIADGEVDFGIVNAEQILQLRAKNDMPLVAVASIYQRLPYAIVSMEGSGITRPQDLVGKRILLWSGDNIYDFFLNQVGLEHSDLIELQGEDLGGFSSSYLIEGEVDAMLGYVTDEKPRLEAQGYATNLIVFNDYGVDVYPNLLVTTEQMIEEKPEIVQAFVNATLRGLNYATSNPNEVATYVTERYAVGDPIEIQLSMLQHMVPLINVSGKRIGSMDAESWEYTGRMLVESGLLADSPDITQAYDMRFVNEFYKE